MKILESTSEQLVIGRETSDVFELLCLTVVVNLLVSTCGVVTFPLIGKYAYALCFVVGSLLILLAGPKDRGIMSYLFVVVFAFVPFLGAVFLSAAVLSLLQVPHIASLTFDKSKNRLTIKKSKLLFWYPTTQYPLDQVIEARLGTTHIFISSTDVRSAPVVLLARRRRNGRETKKTILVGAEATFDLVNQINRFLLVP